jgi:hypothetical protein
VTVVYVTLLACGLSAGGIVVAGLLCPADLGPPPGPLAGPVRDAPAGTRPRLAIAPGRHVATARHAAPTRHQLGRGRTWARDLLPALPARGVL